MLDLQRVCCVQDVCVRVCTPFVVGAHAVHELEGVVYRRETAGLALAINGTYGVIP